MTHHTHDHGDGPCEICAGGSAETVLANARVKIEQLGWNAIYVGGSSKSPPFTYTIGFVESYDHPDIVIAGVSARTASYMNERIAARARDGEAHEEGVDYVGVIAEPYAVRFRAVDPVEAQMTFARLHYGRDDFPAFQVLWPDADGIFPDEDGYHVDAFPQPILPAAVPA